VYPLYSLFLQERVGAQRNARGGDPNPEAVDRECDTVASRSASVVGGVEGEKGEPGGGGGGGAVKQPFVDRPFSVHPCTHPWLSSSSRQQRGDLYVSIMSSRYQGTIDDVAISPTSRSDDFDNGILTFVTYRCSRRDRLRPMISAMLLIIILAGKLQ